MSSLTTLESGLTKDFRRYHLAAQALRLLGGSVSTFLVELAADGTHGWSTKALIAAAVGAVWTTARVQWPTLPWSLVSGHLQAAKASEAAAVAAGQGGAAPGSAAPDNATQGTVTQGNVIPINAAQTNAAQTSAAQDNAGADAATCGPGA
ncbi:hypothetical protein ABH920_006379 [Catenulispora sp. EB89]|uniref:hypothetical protein n=1 Tax=Catenulispora sp. EB89 TaxID=3156257 RepID=UPI0035161F0A